MFYIIATKSSQVSHKLRPQMNQTSIKTSLNMSTYTYYSHAQTPNNPFMGTYLTAFSDIFLLSELKPVKRTVSYWYNNNKNQMAKSTIARWNVCFMIFLNHITTTIIIIFIVILLSSERHYILPHKGGATYFTSILQTEEDKYPIGHCCSSCSYQTGDCNKQVPNADWTLYASESDLVPISRMSSARTMLSSVSLLAVGGLGYGMWCIIAPGEERRRELIKVILPTSGSNVLTTTKC